MAITITRPKAKKPKKPGANLGKRGKKNTARRAKGVSKVGTTTIVKG